MEFYRNKRSKVVYRTFNQNNQDRRLSEVTTDLTRVPYIVNTANVQLVIIRGNTERILEWTVSEGWHRI
jgi:glutamine phosphoribosylpyrophosphate amidotransferase